MKIEIVDERSIAPELLRIGGNVLDVGARGYVFAREMARRGCRVIAMDPEPVPKDFSINGVSFVEAGLVELGKGGRYQFASWDNGEPDCLIGCGGTVPDRASVREVNAVDIKYIMEQYGVQEWDCVKMNCEGAEFGILKSWPGPIAKQISVSFHDHTGANICGEATYVELLAHLGQWYDVFRHVWEERYGAGGSYWDSLFVRRNNA